MSAEGWDRRWVVVETGSSKARGVTSAKWSSQVTPIGSPSWKGGRQEAARIQGLGPWGRLPLPSGHKGPWCWQRSQSDFTGPTDKGRGLAKQVTVL